MLKPIMYWLLATLVPYLCVGQDSNEELIDWNKSRYLSWSDYKGSPNPNSDAAAATTTYLGIEYNVGQNGFTYKIQCKFSKTKSWGKSKTDYILQHEQGHFDIAEIFARKLNKKMSQYEFKQSSYRKDLKEIYDEVTNEKEETQNKYDRETDHSRKKEQQGEWIKKIEKMLEELKEYAGY
ncbi:MAG: DUF922 domain-containing protein [Chitinophagaceae bacterium]|nr:DUF922 domain-containing protein [Chitinophagaceae bacterium]